MKSQRSHRISKRAAQVQSFHVMDLLARARQMQSQGREVLHLEVGEPDFATPQPIIDAGIEALRNQYTHYTAATGLPELRQAIADYYRRKYAVEIDARRIVVTPGASGALQLALAALLDVGEEVLLSDPGYPCNRNIAQLLGIHSRSVHVDASCDYQLTASHIENHWAETTRAAMVASPSNPTGTRLDESRMRELIDSVDNRDGYLIVDEIYQGLVYDVEDYSALKLSDDIFVINSFSKYFGMTGWRLGWMVVPDAFVESVDRMAQNLFLAAPTMSQHAALAALAAFSDETEMILQQRREEFHQRRDFLLPALRSLGFKLLVKPEGAFYIYADCSAVTEDSFAWCHDLLEQAGVAVTPGIDFGDHEANLHLRFAYTRPVEELEKAIDRISKYIKNNL